MLSTPNYIELLKANPLKQTVEKITSKKPDILTEILNGTDRSYTEKAVVFAPEPTTSQVVNVKESTFINVARLTRPVPEEAEASETFYGDQFVEEIGGMSD